MSTAAHRDHLEVSAARTPLSQHRWKTRASFHCPVRLDLRRWSPHEADHIPSLPPPRLHRLHPGGRPGAATPLQPQSAQRTGRRGGCAVAGRCLRPRWPVRRGVRIRRGGAPPSPSGAEFDGAPRNRRRPRPDARPGRARQPQADGPGQGLHGGHRRRQRGGRDPAGGPSPRLPQGGRWRSGRERPGRGLRRPGQDRARGRRGLPHRRAQQRQLAHHLQRRPRTRTRRPQRSPPGPAGLRPGRFAPGPRDRQQRRRRPPFSVPRPQRRSGPRHRGSRRHPAHRPRGRRHLAHPRPRRPHAAPHGLAHQPARAARRGPSARRSDRQRGQRSPLLAQSTARGAPHQLALPLPDPARRTREGRDAGPPSGHHGRDGRPGPERAPVARGQDRLRGPHQLHGTRGGLEHPAPTRSTCSPTASIPGSSTASPAACATTSPTCARRRATRSAACRAIAPRSSATRSPRSSRRCSPTPATGARPPSRPATRATTPAPTRSRRSCVCSATGW